MSTALLVLIIAAWLGWLFAALMVGLWLGERGRRQAAERMLVYGAPEEASAKKPTARAPSPETEAAFLSGRLSEDTIERATQGLMAAARERGEEMSVEQARHDVLLMLSGHDVDE